MSKRGRKNNEEFHAFRAEITYKRIKKGESTSTASDMEYITVQWLSSNVRGCIKNMLVLEC